MFCRSLLNTHTCLFCSCICTKLHQIDSTVVNTPRTFRRVAIVLKNYASKNTSQVVFLNPPGESKSEARMFCQKPTMSGEARRYVGFDNHPLTYIYIYIYIYMYICISTYICIYLHIHVHTVLIIVCESTSHLHEYVYVYIHIHVDIHICIYVYIYIYVYKHIFIYMYMFKCICVCINM